MCYGVRIKDAIILKIAENFFSIIFYKWKLSIPSIFNHKISKNIASIVNSIASDYDNMRPIDKTDLFSQPDSDKIDEKTGKPVRRTKIAPLLIYEIDVPDAGGRDSKSVLESIYEQGTMSITITRVLLHNLEKRFAYIPKALVTEWGKDGTQNELFPLLLSELLSLFGNYKDAALKIQKKLKIQHKEENISEKESDEIINEKVKEALTCTILFKSIAENSVYDYVTKGRWDRMEDQVCKDMEWFKNTIHLITEYRIVGRGSNKEVVFVFNMDYPSANKTMLIENC